MLILNKYILMLRKTKLENAENIVNLSKNTI